MATSDLTRIRSNIQGMIILSTVYDNIGQGKNILAVGEGGLLSRREAMRDATVEELQLLRTSRRFESGSSVAGA